MTPEERALIACDKMADPQPRDVIIIAAAIREAVAEGVAQEREACAKVCERVHAENRRMGLTDRPCSDEAAAIRARGLFE